MVGSTVINDGAVELLSMWISPEFRGRGVGDAAVHAVIDWVRVNYPGRAVVLSVKTTNHRAIALYTRHGFMEFGQSANSADEALMRRDGER